MYKPSDRITHFLMVLAMIIISFILVFAFDNLTDKTMLANFVSSLGNIDLEPDLGNSLLFSIWIGMSFAVFEVTYLIVERIYKKEKYPQLTGLFAGLVLFFFSLVPGVSIALLSICTWHIFFAEEPLFSKKKL